MRLRRGLLRLTREGVPRRNAHDTPRTKTWSISPLKGYEKKKGLGSVQREGVCRNGAQVGVEEGPRSTRSQHSEMADMRPDEFPLV